ncbi:hypothetical protein FW774_12510 [Pedobacter sp. BS3]|uniref:DUF5689 domain-containing protein n=1 Tax=Pedobacter sp. BS3 TaxID=2567937 RepID=UPI0011ECA88F|nr:DUF5689 domain-containing protein [Pedobacter sp. BS3]TZF83117.1 hypothetical protein FW774_12510 [Pedobacter sp. BS3]
MKTIHYLLLALLLLAISSCFKEKDTLLGVPTKNMSIHILRQMDDGGEILLTKDNVGAAPLSGTVISDAQAGNIEKGKFVIVQNKEGVTAGITVSLQGMPDVTYIPGDSLVLDVLGSTLKRVGGQLEITNVPLAKISKVAAGKTVSPLLVSLDELARNFNQYESMLVTVAGADIVLDAGEPQTYAGTKKMDDSSNEPGTVNLNTLSTAVFATEEIPLVANFTGIAVRINNTLNMRMRSLGDVNVPNGQKQETKLIITGYVTNPSGSDANNEYVQLMATEDINFAETPYAVISCYTSYTGTWETSAPVKGWVTGTVDSKKAGDPTSQTTKFNITSGEVKAGQFFYVGGAVKKINGSSSTDISETAVVEANRAKWMRVLSYGSTPWVGDDGVGGGIFGALWGNSEAPQGIAVFNTTNVTSATVPVDVVFFGTFPTSSTDQKRLYDNSGSTELGYRICNTDRYSVANGEFFAKGGNTYLYAPATSADATATAKFYRLGGVYDRVFKMWIMPREVTEITMTTSSSLSLIETGTGLTTLLSK